MSEGTSGAAAAEKKKKKKNGFHVSGRAVVWTVFILVLIVFTGIVYGYPKVSDATADTMTVEYGELKKSETLDVYIVKDETVYYSDVTGTAGYNFEEGTMVRRGTSVVALTKGEAEKSETMIEFNKRVNGLTGRDPFLSDKNDDADDISAAIADEISSAKSSSVDTTMLEYYRDRVDNITSQAPGYAKSADESTPGSVRGLTGVVTQASGVVSYQLDGLESEINPATMELLDEDALKEIDGSSVNICDGTAVKGEPLFKIVDNRDWYAVAWIDDGDLGKYTEGASITMEIDGEQSVDGKVYKLVDQGERIMLIMNFSTYFDELGAMRKVTADVVTSDENGLIIDNSFIKSVDGTPGVYVTDVEGGDPVFTPVNVIDTDGAQSLVTAGSYEKKDQDGNVTTVETVEVYDELIKKP